MKKSELKNYIRENIISELSESTEDEIIKTKELTSAIKDLESAKKEAGIEEANISLADLGEMGYEAGEKAFDMHFDKSILRNTPDTKSYSKGFVQAIIDSAQSLRLNENEGIKEATYSNQYVDKNRIASNKYQQANAYKASYDSIGQVSSEKQFDDDNIDKKAVKGAKKNKGLAKAAEELALLTREMKSLAKKYSKAEGADKEKLVKILKDKTKLKKELESILDNKKI